MILTASPSHRRSIGNARICCFMDTNLVLCMPAHKPAREAFYNGSSPSFFREDHMGSTLHNKIYLGRSSLLASRRMQAALALGALAGVGLVWAAMRTLK